MLVGACDDLSIPRPLGPLATSPGRVSPALGKSAREPARHRTRSRRCSSKSSSCRRGPTVLVLEDVHWADEATSTRSAVVGRRIGFAPALLVLTFRGGEAPPDHPLHAAVGAVAGGPARCSSSSPRSRRARSPRSRATGAAPFTRRRGGNPFYVTELLASARARSSRSRCATAVRGAPRGSTGTHRRLCWRSCRWCRTACRSRCSTRCMPGGRAAAEEPERRQLLEVARALVRFRHELARHAIASSMTAAARRRVHGGILAALLAAGTRIRSRDRPSRRGARPRRRSSADYAVVAARRAAALESPREAFSHYLRAADFVDRLPAARAGERSSTSSPLRPPTPSAASTIAFPAIERRDRDLSRARRPDGRGRCTRVLSRCQWFAGDGDAARRTAQEAIAILEPLGESGGARRRLQRALPARDARRGQRRGARDRGDRPRARHPARGRATRGPMRSSTSAPTRCSSIPTRSAMLLEALAVADARATVTKPRGR